MRAFPTFEIFYKSGDAEKRATGDNADFSLRDESTATRCRLVLRANNDIEILGLRQARALESDKRDLYFLNGYQSWTDTKETYYVERERNVKKLPAFLLNAFSFDGYGDTNFYDYANDKLHGYDVFYRKGKSELFVLNLNYAAAYLVIEVNKSDKLLKLSYDYGGTAVAAGAEFVVADYRIANSVTEGMALFADAFPKKPTRKIFGYTSWYNYYQNIDEHILLRDLDALDGNFNLFQIDDGYETHVGDWLSVDRRKFPNGLEPIVRRAHEKGLMAGIWLAPFVAEENSEIYKNHKEMFKKLDSGECAKCGSNWGGFYAFDLSRSDAREYIENCLTHYVDMGFDFFKLDFLYAASLVPDNGSSRSATAERAYGFLRDCLGDKLILGCGATVFNCIDKFDYLRVGPDVSLDFDDVWYMRFMHRERISTKVTVQNTIYRSFFNERLFGNDPDVFLLRKKNIRLSDKQKTALITLNALFGSVLMTSDNLSDYDGAQRQTLAEALELFKNAEVSDYARHGDIIVIDYTMSGKPQRLKYDTKRGILIRARTKRALFSAIRSIKKRLKKPRRASANF